ncbi:MAG: hypothetical protein ACE5F8_05570 [Woeseiaceae bacterium]
MTHTDDQKALEEERQLLELLKDYPMPHATEAFYDQALVRAAREGTRRQRNRWIMTGFGSAVAAGIVMLLVSGVFFSAPDTPRLDANIAGVTMALAEPRTVNLVFSSAQALDAATLTVSLPDGIEMAGFPGQREIAWETNLAEGKNLLPLKLIALTPAGGEVLARLEHNDRNRTFRLQVEVS